MDMMDGRTGASALAVDDAGLEEDFTLDVRVVEALSPVAQLMLSTSDECGSTCEDGATACVSDTADPS
jgi:FxLD family lantipeptide